MYIEIIIIFYLQKNEEFNIYKRRLIMIFKVILEVYP